MEPVSKQRVMKAVKAGPRKTGYLSLLTGIFKVPTKRTVTLWADKLVFSAPNKPTKVGGYILAEHLHVSPAEGGRTSQKFVVRDGASRTDHVFVAVDATEAALWMETIRTAVQDHLAARRRALQDEKARMDAIAERLGVNAVRTSASRHSAPPAPADVERDAAEVVKEAATCLLFTSPSPRDRG